MAWNEPGGEKRNPWNRPQSQNDLDDVLRNFQKRLSALFRRSGAGGSGGSKSANIGRGFGSVLVLVVAAWIGSGLYRVDQQERAVILRFGKYVQTTGPGYNWHLPFPIESTRIVNVSHIYPINDDARMLTADTNLVVVKTAVQYTQPDPIKYLFRVKNVEETLIQVSESAMREAVGQSTLDKALAFDPSITERAKVMLQRTIDSYDMGIHILSVNLNDVQVEDAVQDAQRDAIKADKDRQRYQQEAELYRNDAIPRARGEAAKRVQDAEAYQLQVTGLAEGETSRFDQVLAQYDRAPAVTRERMYLDAIGGVLKNSRKIIVDVKNGSNMMYLPLDKLGVSNAAPSASNDTMTVAPMRVPETPTQPPEDPARARGKL